MESHHFTSSFECISQAYATTSARINRHYHSQLQKLTGEGLKILNQYVDRYLNNKIKKMEDDEVSQAPTVKASSRLAILSTKKDIEGHHSTPQKLASFHASTKKSKFQTQMKVEEANNYEEQKVIKALKKMSMGNDNFSFDDDEENQNNGNMNKIIPSSLKKKKFFYEEDAYNFGDDQDQQPPEDLGNKSLREIAEMSIKKIQQTQAQDAENPFDSQGEMSEYRMTEYSSNESSNDNDYSPMYREESLKPLFGDLFSKQNSQNSNDENSKLSAHTVHSSMFTSGHLTFKPYNPNEFLNSPKKTKKTKRLYIREKRIPKWAQDMKQMENDVNKQRLALSPKLVFGRFVAECVNSNSILHLQEDIKRASSAKWNYNRMFVE